MYNKNNQQKVYEPKTKMSDYIPGLTKMLTKDSEYTLTNILPIDKIDKLEMMKGLQ